jgi:7,8-dihydropterin-6-yl-methyl-4-(beta-D-ribofuranosyl)aminobenzene 5'-phosphate synthase
MSSMPRSVFRAFLPAVAALLAAPLLHAAIEGSAGHAASAGPYPPARGEQPDRAQDRSVEIKVLFDNYTTDPKLATAWGFAALVTFDGHTILFDTGADGTMLVANADLMDVDLNAVEAIVISHAHADHTAGLPAVLDRIGPRPLYLLGSFPASLREGAGHQCETTMVPDAGFDLFEGLHLTGNAGGSIPEQALVAETSEGLVVVTGCAHPGILEIVRLAAERYGRPIHLVMGGFHLGGQPMSSIQAIIEGFRELGVAHVAPTHCTGDEAIAAFREAWGSDFVQAGVGAVIRAGRDR